jgi:hypothetical protein
MESLPFFVLEFDCRSLSGYASQIYFLRSLFKMDDNAYLDTIKDINWDTFYQQKMALESLTDYLHRNKEQENGMFGRAAAWMEGILTMMDGFTDAAADENAFSYPARDENDRHLDSRFNDVLDQYPQASA